MNWHTRQSVHNYDAQQYLSRRPSNADWEVTALFYSAVHAVDEYLFTIGKTPQNHIHRSKLIRKNIQHIYPDYYSLYCLCRKVRYEIPYDDVSEGDKQTAVDLYNSIRQKLETDAHTNDHN